MSLFEIKERMDALVKELNQHNYNYYVLAQPTISDFEFDIKLKELEALEKQHPEYQDENSPTQKIGGDIVRDPVTVGVSLPIAPVVLARVADAPRGPSVGLSLPRRWPLDEPGYITRGQVGTGSRDEVHPGLDIAVTTGSLVRAAGGGTVHQLGEDPEYGFFVLLDHPDDYQTMYGHLSRIVVQPGASVAPGQVIGLSGNTGRSTAPHLHFEIRQKGVSVDPRTMIKEGS